MPDPHVATLFACQDRLQETALRALRDALGVAHVIEGQAVAGHVDPYSFLGAKTMAPAAVALPATVGEVQAVLRVATEHAIPLWTVSAGRNYAYGGASPRLPGSLVVDLSRMDRVLAVDEECCTALLEPGVTFMALHEHLRAAGSRLAPSVPDIGWGSVTGNALERGFGYTPYGDHSAMQCGLEVVLATGEVVRTGMGAKAGGPAWQLYKGGYGPALDGLFQQSNFGIVTKMGLWMMPRPQVTAACAVQAPGADDLAPLIDALRPLLIDGTIQSNVVIGNAVIIAAMIGNRAEFCATAAPIGQAGLDAIMAKFHIGHWNARFAVYGAPEMVEARLACVRCAMEALPGARFDVRAYPSDVAQEAVHPADRALLGIPSLDMVRVAAWRGGQPAHTDFSLICPPTGRDALQAMRLIREGVEAHGFDYAGGFTLFPRHAVALALVAFDRDDADQTARVAKLFPHLLARAAVIGAAPYRSHVAFMDQIAAQYDFGGQALLRLTERLKDMIDPVGILSPGKQGIWPGRSAQHALHREGP